MLPLVSVQVDYTAAFVESPIDKPPNYDKMSEAEKARVGVFVQMPRGFAQPGKVLSLKASFLQTWKLTLKLLVILEGETV